MNYYYYLALTVSVRIGRPEIAILPSMAGELDFRDQVLLCRTEFLLDYSRHPGHEERLVCSLSNFHILAASKKRRAEKMVNYINMFKISYDCMYLIFSIYKKLIIIYLYRFYIHAT